VFAAIHLRQSYKKYFQMNIEQTFTQTGGTFCIPYQAFQEKTSRLKAFIFDWDGVFNDGTKDHHGSSSFNEVDSMGTNLLRFGHWLNTGTLPITAVMSGERNVLSFQFTNREHFHHGYFKTLHKALALEHFLSLHSLKAEEVAFVFDDVLDLGLAAKAGLRIMVGRSGNPLFRQYVVNNQLADYITSGSSYAVRETCELLLGVSGSYEKAVHDRSVFADSYQGYLKARQAVGTTYYSFEDGVIVPKEI
jgi:3-deoxy-D-manno-octulosonate 8-phosphate phosphatase (KDO 8-P phosphatase)